MENTERWRERKDNAAIKTIAQVIPDAGKYIPGTLTQSLTVCVYIDGERGQFTPGKWPWYAEVNVSTWNAERFGSDIEFLSLFGPFDSYNEARQAALNFRDKWAQMRAKGLPSGHRIFI